MPSMATSSARAAGSACPPRSTRPSCARPSATAWARWSPIPGTSSRCWRPCPRRDEGAARAARRPTVTGRRGIPGRSPAAGGTLTSGVGSRSGAGRPGRGHPGETTMLRTRVLHPRWLTVALVLWATVWLTLPAPADAAPLPPARASTAPGDASSAVEIAALQQALVAQGLSPVDAEQVLARLTPAERAELAQRAGELAVGGDGTLLIIILIVVAAILLYLPLAGKMQGWW